MGRKRRWRRRPTRTHGAGGSGEVLEQAITCAAHNRFGKADPGYIARDGGWGPWASHPQVAHAPGRWWVKGGRAWVRASQPNGGGEADGCA